MAECGKMAVGEMSNEQRSDTNKEPPSSNSKQPRPIGLDEGKIMISPEFWDPLPDELLDYFKGEK